MRECDNCPTNHSEMSDIHRRLDSGARKMRNLHRDIKINRFFDKLILLVAIISLLINLFK